MSILAGKRIAVVGLGTIGVALVEGMLARGAVDRGQIAGSTAHPRTAEAMRARLKVEVTTDNRGLVQGRDVVLLTVKPKDVARALAEVRDVLTPEQLVVVVAAATTVRYVEEHLGRPIPVVRAMPNTPCQIGLGMTAIYPGTHADERHLGLAQAVFATVGRVALVEEELMDAVTALSGSGPAYAYIIVEALAEGGVKMGLPRKLATELAAQAILGVAALVLDSGQHPALLKDDVTTPAGVTIDGLMSLEEGGLRVALIKAVMAATERGKTLSL